MSTDPISEKWPFEEWQERLGAVAHRAPYVFVDTPQKLIDDHFRELTRFEGYEESGIVRCEQELDVRFPAAYRDFLLCMGKASGDLLCGSDQAGLEDLEDFRKQALELIEESGSTFRLPDDAVVWLFHQGYQFTYFRCNAPRDTPQMLWSEGEDEPMELAASFIEFVEARLEALEAGHRHMHERGGYYLTLYADGGGKQHYPALDSGDRPLDHWPGGTAMPPRPSLFQRLRQAVSQLGRR